MNSHQKPPLAGIWIAVMEKSETGLIVRQMPPGHPVGRSFASITGAILQVIFFRGS
jgi:hypothetical protein